ncbi:hypothetical protein SEMRO_1677_G290601.1 [Seminavis robusta]|uniref:Uncharacterized protein n=1 Tax=Seminavis robusta TaxID=568900 RepID=A0A9N8EQM7_9STRA|nr:hypothetical protein SEMRO_1677_G290601.1 [Seminavis robusta]|eukprot:Sro1677_g290601.1  (165) ;mRNA; r:19484-19978
MSQSPSLPPSVSMQAEPSSWRSNQELYWGLANQVIPDLDNLPDMFYDHVAIFSQGCLDCAVNQFYNHQEYKKNQIFSTQQHRPTGCSRNSSTSLFDHFPDFLLNFDFDPEVGNYLLVFDLTTVDNCIFRCPAKTKPATSFSGYRIWPKHVSIPRGCQERLSPNC